MAGKGEGEGTGIEVNKLEGQIACIKYTLFCLNIITWILGAAMFGIALWLRVEPGFEEWVTFLSLQKYYIGIYILIIGSLIVMAVSFVGCASALMENVFALMLFIGSQVLGFLLGLIGSAILLDYSTYDSHIQPLIRDAMLRLIMNAHHAPSRATVAMIQENIGCCGADGPVDYLMLKQPFPSECRDTVTGNAFYHGCVDELSWYMESKAVWLTFVTMAMCFVCVINVVLSTILIQALKKEEDEATGYSHEKNY